MYTVIKTVVAKDIEILDIMSAGQILVRYDFSFTIGCVYYECLCVATQMICVGYGTRPSDSKVILLKLEQVAAVHIHTYGTLEMEVIQQLKTQYTHIQQLEYTQLH